MNEKPRVAVLLAYDQDPERWRRRFERGEALDETPYGYERAQGDAELVWATSSAESAFARRVRHRMAGFLGFDLVHAWRNRRLLFDADVVWTHTEREHLAVALLQLLRPPRRRVRVLAQSVWLWDTWERWGRFRRGFVALLLKTHAIEVVHSRRNLAASRSSVEGRRVELLPFGSAGLAPGGTQDGPGENVDVIAVGNDIDRDWSVLAEAARLLPDVRFRIVSRSGKAKAQEWPENALCREADSMEELARVYAATKVVVLPLRPNLHASGATSCIEAMASGAVVVATAVGGIEDYLGSFGQTVPAGDPEALARAVEAGMAGAIPPAPRDAVQRRGLTQGDYVARYVRVTHWIVGGAPWDPRVSDFAPLT